MEHLIARPAESMNISGEPARLNEKKMEEKISLPDTGHEIILSRNLFGSLTADEKAEPPPPEPSETAQPSSLDLVLKGTIVSAEGTERAVIMDKNNFSQDLYEQGDMVQSAIIKQITRGKVILTYNGIDEFLDMSDAANFRSTPTADSSYESITSPPGGVAAATGAISSQVETSDIFKQTLRRIQSRDPGRGSPVSAAQSGIGLSPTPEDISPNASSVDSSMPAPPRSEKRVIRTLIPKRAYK